MQGGDADQMRKHMSHAQGFGCAELLYSDYARLPAALETQLGARYCEMEDLVKWEPTLSLFSPCMQVETLSVLQVHACCPGCPAALGGRARLDALWHGCSCKIFLLPCWR